MTYRSVWLVDGGKHERERRTYRGDGETGVVDVFKDGTVKVTISGTVYPAQREVLAAMITDPWKPKPVPEVGDVVVFDDGEGDDRQGIVRQVRPDGVRVTGMMDPCHDRNQLVGWSTMVDPAECKVVGTSEGA